MPAIQPTPVQSQPVDEVGNAPDRVWYRFWDSLAANAPGLPPVSSLLGGDGTGFVNVSVGAGLSLSSGHVLAAQSIFVPAPPHNNSPGSAGQLAFDSGFFYVCVATDTWARVAIGGMW